MKYIMLKNRSNSDSSLILSVPLNLLTCRVSIWEKCHIRVCYCVSLSNSTFKGLTKLTTVGVCVSWKSANITSQGLISCFADYLELRK